MLHTYLLRGGTSSEQFNKRKEVNFRYQRIEKPIITKIEFFNILSEARKLKNSQLLDQKFGTEEGDENEVRELELSDREYALMYLNRLEMEDSSNFITNHWDIERLDFPKKSMSIPLTPGVNGIWAPNGYGKSYIFREILSKIQHVKGGNSFEKLYDFLDKIKIRGKEPRKFISNSIQMTANGPISYTSQEEFRKQSSLVPFTGVSFTIGDYDSRGKNNIATFSIFLDFDSRGNLDIDCFTYSEKVEPLNLVQEGVNTPSYSISSEFDRICSINEYSSHSLDYGFSETLENFTWVDQCLELLFNLSVDYNEIPMLAFSNPESSIYEAVNQTLQINNKLVINELKSNKDLFREYSESSGIKSTDDLDTFMTNLFTSFYSKLKLSENYDKITDKIKKIQSIEENKNPWFLIGEIYGKMIEGFENNLNVSINSSEIEWGIKIFLTSSDRIPLKFEYSDLDSEKNNSPNWEKMSFGQKTVILFNVLLEYCKAVSDIHSDSKIQRVFVIDEPEAGRSERWVRELIHQLIETKENWSKLNKRSSLCILSHRGELLDYVSGSEGYNVMTR